MGLGLTFAVGMATSALRSMMIGACDEATLVRARARARVRVRVRVRTDG